MDTYTEKEVKILDVDVENLVKKLDKLGAKKVFDADRIFTYFDYDDGKLRKLGEEVRLTEEEKLKLSFSRRLENREKETIKVFVSRKKEIVDFLLRLGLYPIAEIKSHRISYELGTIDFDIDIFPKIPPFLEIDLGDSPQMSLNDLIKYLDLESKEMADISTHEIYSRMEIDFFDRFKINK